MYLQCKGNRTRSTVKRYIHILELIPMQSDFIKDGYKHVSYYGITFDDKQQVVSCTHNTA